MKQIKILFFVFILLVSSCQEKPVYLNTKLSFEERADNLLSQLTLEEKADLMRYDSPAIDRLGIPAYNWWNECLHGVGRSGLATVFPQAIGMAAMWDSKQMFDIATAISDEARAKHHNYVSQGKRGIYQGLTCWTRHQYFSRSDGKAHENIRKIWPNGRAGDPFHKRIAGRRFKVPEIVATANILLCTVVLNLRHSFDVSFGL